MATDESFLPLLRMPCNPISEIKFCLNDIFLTFGRAKSSSGSVMREHPSRTRDVKCTAPSKALGIAVKVRDERVNFFAFAQSASDSASSFRIYIGEKVKMSNKGTRKKKKKKKKKKAKT